MNEGILDYLTFPNIMTIKPELLFFHNKYENEWYSKHIT